MARQQKDWLDQSMDSFRKEFELGERLEGTVTAIDGETVFVDIGTRSEGILPAEQTRDSNGELTVAEGDDITVFYAGEKNGEIRLKKRVSSDADAESILDACEAKMPIEGRVSREIKGGFEVMIGSHRGFCPYSQIDLHRQDPEAYLNEKFLFEITECDDRLRNLVLSRRAMLERRRREQKEKLKETLQPNTVVEGTVRRIVDFGVFVDLGGIDGLVPLGELAWGRKVKPEDIVKEGDKVNVLVRDVDWDRERISLSLRYAEGNPWDNAADKYVAGQHVAGTVAKLMPFGAFVELEPGIDGLLHISKIGGGKRINHPSEELEEGQTIDVVIENVDIDNERISLALEGQDVQTNEDEASADDLRDHLRPSDRQHDFGSIGDVLDDLKL